MRKVYPFIGLLSVIFLLTCFSSCKKNNENSIGFNVSQVSLDAYQNPNATVTITLSQPVNGVTDLWLQNIGPDTLQFGSFSSRFINDDSDRIVGTLGPQASIDTPTIGYMVHITFPEGATSVSIALTALANNFPLPAKEYRIKMVQANNGTIVSGKNTLTINIAAAAMVPVFHSSLTIKDVIYGFDTVIQYNSNTMQFDTVYNPDSTIISSAYNLASASFVPAAQPGTYNFSLSYSIASGNDTATTFNLSCLGITPSVGTNTYPTTTGVGTITTKFMLSPTPNQLYGNYYIMNNTAKAITWSNGGHRKVATDTLGCSFIVF